MEFVHQDSQLAKMLDNVAATSPNLPFALMDPNGQPLFLGTKFIPSRAAASPPAGPAMRPLLVGTVSNPTTQLAPQFAKPSGMKLLAFSMVTFVDAFGLPLSAMINAFQAVRTTPATGLAQWAATQPPASSKAAALFDFSTLEALQKGRKLHPGRPPDTVQISGMTFTVYDTVTLMGDLKLSHGVVVAEPAAPVAQPATGSGFLSDKEKLNDFVSWMGDAPEVISKLYPDLGPSMAIAGEVVEGLAIVTSTMGAIDAFRRGDNKALGNYSLTLGVSAIDLFGAVGGHPALCNFALLLKLAKPGWAIFYPSKDQTSGLQIPGNATVPVRAYLPGTPTVAIGPGVPVSSPGAARRK
jgi:hypothetical protein